MQRSRLQLMIAAASIALGTVLTVAAPAVVTLTEPATMADPTSAAPSPSPTPRAPVSGGVLNGKAISKPAPAYPPIA
jgi:hypothetical protein